MSRRVRVIDPAGAFEIDELLRTASGSCHEDRWIDHRRSSMVCLSPLVETLNPLEP